MYCNSQQKLNLKGKQVLVAVGALDDAATLKAFDISNSRGGGGGRAANHNKNLKKTTSEQFIISASTIETAETSGSRAFPRDSPLETKDIDALASYNKKLLNDFRLDVKAEIATLVLELIEAGAHVTLISPSFPSHSSTLSSTISLDLKVVLSTTIIPSTETEALHHLQSLKLSRDRGEFGYVQRMPSPLDIHHYHWSILVPGLPFLSRNNNKTAEVASLSDVNLDRWIKDMRKEALTHFRFVSIVNDQSSDEEDLPVFFKLTIKDIIIHEDKWKDIRWEGSIITPSSSELSISLKNQGKQDIANVIVIKEEQEGEDISSDDSTSINESKTGTLIETVEEDLTDTLVANPAITKLPCYLNNVLQSQPNRRRRPILYLVGSGPGSADLLTLRAHHLLQTVPIIITDRLVSPDIFSSVPSSSKILFSRKVCGKAKIAQDEINAWIIQYLDAGLDVIRVKGGDPFVYGRGGEEWELVHQYGYDVEWVPGISSCIAAAGAAGIPVTHRGVADSFIVATGQKQDGSLGNIPSYSPSRTLILLMAIGVLDKLPCTLASLGYPMDSRVAVVYRATWPDQQVIRGSLMTISQKVIVAGIKSHAAIVIGGVVDVLSKKPLPLFGNEINC